MALPHDKRVLAGMFLLLSVVALVVVITVVQSPQNIFSKAWSGVVTNVQSLRLQLGLQPGGVVAVLPEAAESKTLFAELNKAYPTAEVQEIDIGELNMRGQAVSVYDAAMGRSFVWSRVENLPVPGKGVARWWLVKQNSQEYVPVGIVEFVKEGDKPVGYSVFTQAGDLGVWQEMVLAYDPTTTATVPSDIALILEF